MALHKSKAYLLHRRAYRDSSIICDFYSQSHGKISAVARAGRSKKGWQLSLHAYIPLWISWKGEHGLLRLTHCEPTSGGLSLKGHRLYCGFYLNELLLKLCPNAEENHKLFTLYEQSILHLTQKDISPTLRSFEKNMLELLGYGLHLPDDQHSHYGYDHSRGLIPANPSPHTLSRAHIQAILNEDWSDPESLDQAKKLFRYIIDQLLPYPLKSRQFFQEIKT